MLFIKWPFLFLIWKSLTHNNQCTQLSKVAQTKHCCLKMIVIWVRQACWKSLQSYCYILAIVGFVSNNDVKSI